MLSPVMVFTHVVAYLGRFFLLSVVNSSCFTSLLEYYIFQEAFNDAQSGLGLSSVHCSNDSTLNTAFSISSHKYLFACPSVKWDCKPSEDEDQVLFIAISPALGLASSKLLSYVA